MRRIYRVAASLGAALALTGFTLSPEGRCANVWERGTPQFHACVERQQKIDQHEEADAIDATRAKVKVLARDIETAKKKAAIEQSAGEWLERFGIDPNAEDRRARFSAAVNERMAYAVVAKQCFEEVATSLDQAAFTQCLRVQELVVTRRGQKMDQPLP